MDFQELQEIIIHNVEEYEELQEIIIHNVEEEDKLQEIIIHNLGILPVEISMKISSFHFHPSVMSSEMTKELKVMAEICMIISELRKKDTLILHRQFKKYKIK